MQGSRRLDASLLALAVVLVASLAWLVSLQAVGLVLSNDGPSHLLQCHIFGSLGDPGSPYAGLFTANVPATARGACELQLLLERVLSWRAIHQLLLGLPSVLFTLAAWTAARAIHPRRAWVALVVAALPAHTLLYYGLFPYALGAGVAALGVGVAVAESARGASAGWRAALAFGTALLVVALCHAVAALFLSVLVGAVLLGSARSARDRARAALRHTLCALPALAVLVRALGYATDPTEQIVTSYLSLALHLRVLFAWAQAGGTARELVAVALPALGVALTGWRWRRVGPGERALAAAALAALLLFWVLPQDALGFRIFSPRALVFFVTFGLAGLPIEALPQRLRSLTPPALAVLVAAQLVWLHGFHRERARAAELALAFLEAPLPAPGVRLPIPLDPYLGRASGEAWGIFGWVPGLHLGQLYALTQGGAVEYSQDLRATTQWALRTPLSRRATPPELLPIFERLPTPEQRAARALALARAGAPWDGVIVLGDRDEHAVFTRVGYRAEHQNDAVLLARFAGCPLEIATAGLPEGVALTVTARADGDQAPWVAATVQREPGDADLQLQFGGGEGQGPPAPCGRVLVEAVAPWRCEGDPLVVELPQTTRVTCAVRAR